MIMANIPEAEVQEAISRQIITSRLLQTGSIRFKNNNIYVCFITKQYFVVSGSGNPEPFLIKKSNL